MVVGARSAPLGPAVQTSVTWPAKPITGADAARAVYMRFVIGAIGLVTRARSITEVHTNSRFLRTLADAC